MNNYIWATIAIVCFSIGIIIGEEAGHKRGAGIAQVTKTIRGAEK